MGKSQWGLFDGVQLDRVRFPYLDFCTGAAATIRDTQAVDKLTLRRTTWKIEHRNIRCKELPRNNARGGNLPRTYRGAMISGLAGRRPYTIHDWLTKWRGPVIPPTDGWSSREKQHALAEATSEHYPEHDCNTARNRSIAALAITLHPSRSGVRPHSALCPQNLPDA